MMDRTEVADVATQDRNQASSHLLSFVRHEPYGTSFPAAKSNK